MRKIISVSLLALSLAACGDNGEPSQADLQAALAAGGEVPDPSAVVEKMRCAPSDHDKEAFTCKYRFPPADPIEGIFQKVSGKWKHTGPAAPQG